MPRSAIWPLVKRWADSYEYGHLPGEERQTHGNSWTIAETRGGGITPWVALSEATGRSEDWFRDLGRKPNGPKLTFEQADWLLAFIGRPDAWHGELARYYKKPYARNKPRTRTKRRRDSKMSDDALRVAHSFYLRGWSIAAIARDVYERFGYTTDHACAQAIGKGFRRLGLPMRTKKAAIHLAKTTHGLTVGWKNSSSIRSGGPPEYQRHWRRKRGKCRPCAKDGCRCWAMAESEFCNVHSGRSSVIHLDSWRKNQKGIPKKRNRAAT